MCSHDHLTLFLTLVSGLEFIRFDLDLVRRPGSHWAEGWAGWPRSHPGRLMGEAEFEHHPVCSGEGTAQGLPRGIEVTLLARIPGLGGSFLSLSQLGEKPHHLEYFST